MSDKPNGRPRGSKLDGQIQRIRRLARLGYNQKSIAAAIGCHESTLMHWARRNRVKMFDGRGSHTAMRLRDPDVLASQLARLNARYEGADLTEKWQSTKRRRELAKRCFALTGMDTWMEMTAGSVMAVLARRERKLAARAYQAQRQIVLEDVV